ncbi:DUF992 domain-containing protein [Rhodoblastus acidophilus]|uniref:DUF992 domain-containing protein n=1 Tax=Candidatus Rhodoblastus alkanivorans TaxID=2954117 RepID=A0ABS9Z4K1_9HYPH|nr:DUF992 domain-containing protein [Candidatus Rhodoblastus alkanivorans]MCI4677712.1 DUF992 domain-containing protein [Candidatus Rhodoblastus alkanivorans]MCI4682556.1 DUF992 domain-containing protein [Candidatus Rhodoblastus alkanivorans]MDI4639862.1 DUF992 domain-containing protein [Rhodoblastus acidophilus]
MNMRSVLFAVSVAALAFSTHVASADQVQVGTLNCEVAGGPGLIIASNRALVCRFTSQGGRVEHYAGSITKIGVDLGATTKGLLAWAVFAPTSAPPQGALAGSYGGVSGEVTVGVGLGANVLIGGSADTIALQPVSLTAQEGLNVAGGVTGLTLDFVPPPPHHHRRHHHY